MKLSFSTLGCPSWSWDEIVSTAKDFGYDGIEVRGIENEMFVPKSKPFIDENIGATKDRLSKLGLEISCLTSGCLLHKDDKDYVKEGKEYIDIASKLNVKYIRVLGDTNPQAGDNVDIDKVASALNKLALYGENKNVMPLVETNGVFAFSDTMLSLLGKVDSENVGILWDIHHPIRYANENIEETFNKLKGFIKHVHIKDSVVIDDKIIYKLVGEGDLPVDKCVNMLKSQGFEGFISIEWVKRWYTDLSEPDIVFSQFENYMRSFM